jgi:hypothetical protein
VSGGRDGIRGMTGDGGGFFAAGSARFEAVPPMNTIEYGNRRQGINRAMYGGEPTSTESTARHGHGKIAADVSKVTEGSRNGGSAGVACRSRGRRRRKQDKEDGWEGARGK